MALHGTQMDKMQWLDISHKYRTIDKPIFIQGPDRSMFNVCVVSVLGQWSKQTESCTVKPVFKGHSHGRTPSIQ